MKCKYLVGAAVLVMNMIGCASQSTMAPMSVNLNAGSWKKQGSVHAKCYMTFFCDGDLNVHQALVNGSVNRVHHIEMKSTGFPHIYENKTLIVYGE